MSVLKEFAIAKGSKVLITGASGWVGSNITDQFLAHGYKVRGTTRDIKKASWMNETFDKKYGPGLFELVLVPDMVVDNAYDEAVKGVSAVIHTASVLPSDPNPDNVIPLVISGTLNALKAAYAEPSVKRFVLTSSTAATKGPPYEPTDVFNVYAASKTEGEKAVWKYHKEHAEQRPDLIVNTVLPNAVFGKSLNKEKQGHPSSSGFLASIYNGVVLPEHKFVPPQYFVDASDVGRLHVIAAIHPDVKGERLFGVAGRFNWDQILDILRKNEPEKKFPENLSGGTDATEFEPRARAEQLLKELGQPGWITLEESVLRSVEDFQSPAAA